jgi:rhomboid-like protein
VRRTIFTHTPIYRDYVDLPRDYRDDVGLPFRRDPLETYEVLSIFGAHISTTEANKLLRILHGRRVAGTLDDPSVKINTSHFSKASIDAALKYLRHTAPVDEVMNAGLRAEDELRQLEEGEAAPEEEAGPEGAQSTEYKSRYKLYKNQSTDDVYGEGALDKIRARNVARYKEQLKHQEEEKRKREEEEAKARPGGLQTIEERQPRAVSPRMEEWKKKAVLSDMTEPPQMPASKRLVPSTIFVALLVAGFAAYAQFYQPPDWRLWPDYSPATATVGALILLNLAGFALWKLPPAWPLMNRYFMLVAATPKPVSILGAMFSHQAAGHLLLNMLFVWFVGIRLHDEVGRGDFLATYMASGSIGFLATLYSLVLRNQLHLTTLGASGAFYGVATAYFWLHRFDGFKILGLPPDPATGIQGLGFIGLMLALNMTAVFSKNAHRIDVMSHLMGMAVGLAAGAVLERRHKPPAARQMPLQHAKTDLGVMGRIVEKK